jgi:hypothetical protein
MLLGLFYKILMKAIAYLLAGKKDLKFLVTVFFHLLLMHLAVLLYYISLFVSDFIRRLFFKVLIVLKLLDLTVNNFLRVDLPSFYLGPPDQAEDAPSFFFA